MKVNRMAELSTLSADQLKNWLQDGQELALLDVSEALHYGRGHIVAARHLPLSLLELQAPGLLHRRD
ncbi:MAG: sulfurtransferase, partial [Comamonas sp.]